MSIQIADHVREIPRSGIRDFFEIVQTMSDVISLGIGEPDFATPWHIREAAIYALTLGAVITLVIVNGIQKCVAFHVTWSWRPIRPLVTPSIARSRDFPIEPRWASMLLARSNTVSIGAAISVSSSIRATTHLSKLGQPRVTEISEA